MGRDRYDEGLKPWYTRQLILRTVFACSYLILCELFKEDLDCIQNFSILAVIPTRELRHSHMVGVDSVAIFTGITKYSRIPLHDLNREQLRSGCITSNAYRIDTFPMPGIASSSTKDQTVKVPRYKIRLKLSPIRSSVCESLSRSRTRSAFELPKATCAMEATTSASEAKPLPL